MGGHSEGGHVTVPHDIPSGHTNKSNPYAPVILKYFFYFYYSKNYIYFIL